jgi:hypothetical protein
MNYYTQLCFEVEGNAAELKDLFDRYETLHSLDEDPSGYASELGRILIEEGAAPGVNLELKGDTLTIKGYEPYLPVVERIIQLWMKQCDRPGWISFDYAHSASREVPNAYGGGASWISKDKIVSVGTSELLLVDPLAVEELISDAGKEAA